MRKLSIVLGLLILVSCSDEDFTEEKTKESSARTSSLPLYDFDETLIQSGDDSNANNRIKIQEAIDLAASLPLVYSGVEIGDVDCFLNVANNNGLLIPSHFSLVMHDNTRLRISPVNTSNGAGYSLIRIVAPLPITATTVFPNDIMISGGHLYGDRRIQTGDSNQGHVIRLSTCSAVEIDGVEISDANSDGIYITGSEINVAGSANYTPPSFITITNCTIRDSRRCNLTIADGNDLEIHNNTFKGGGINLTKDNGAPSLAFIQDAASILKVRVNGKELNCTGSNIPNV